MKYIRLINTNKQNILRLLSSVCFNSQKSQVWPLKAKNTIDFRKNTYTMYAILIADKGKDKPALRKVEQVCSISFRSSLYPSYFHSFGMTENYIIFVEQAFKLDILKLATAYFRDVNWGSCLKFDKDDIVSKTSVVVFLFV